MKCAEEAATTKAYHQVGSSKRRIAAQLGSSRNTVTRILEHLDTDSGSKTDNLTKLQSCQVWLAQQVGEGSGETSARLQERFELETGLRISRRTMERARALLREQAKQQQTAPGDMLSGWQIGPYQLSASGELTLAGNRLAMPALQEKLLLVLVRQANQLLSRETIIKDLWGENSTHAKTSNNVNLAIHRLRQEFSRGPLGESVIRTVYGKGYIFTASVQPIRSTAVAQMAAATARTGAATASPYYLEAHDYWPGRDPYRLPRQEYLLRKSVDNDPCFGQGLLEVCYLQMLQCLWGMRSALEIRPAVQEHIVSLENLPHKPPGWLGIKAEIQSLLLWQPNTTKRLYGTWLADSLPWGMPQQAWARHLIFTGSPQVAVKLLFDQVRDDLCQGWLNLAMAYLADGQLSAAETAIQKQLRVDPEMIGPRLLLAVLRAILGQPDQATRLILDCGVLDRPFQGVQAIAAYALAKGDLRQRAHQLLEQALAHILEGTSGVGAFGYWGLAALALGRQQEAVDLLKLSIKHRCYSAPVLFSTPLIKPYSQTVAVRLFTSAMRRCFSASA